MHWSWVEVSIWFSFRFVAISCLQTLLISWYLHSCAWKLDLVNSTETSRKRLWSFSSSWTKVLAMMWSQITARWWKAWMQVDCCTNPCMVGMVQWLPWDRTIRWKDGGNLELWGWWSCKSKWVVFCWFYALEVEVICHMSHTSRLLLLSKKSL